MNSTAQVLELPARKSSDFLATSAIASLLKQNLKLNARQVSVAKRSSLAYVDVTVRDASVDLKAVEAFCGNLSTWSCDQTDYCSGQSLDVKTTREVDAAHAAPFVSEIQAKVSELLSKKENIGLELSNGKLIWRRDGEVYITSDSGNHRGCYIRVSDLESGADYAFANLALQAARV